MIVGKQCQVKHRAEKDFVYLWKTGHLTISEIRQKPSLTENTVSIVIYGMVHKNITEWNRTKRNTTPNNRRQTIGSLAGYRNPDGSIASHHILARRNFDENKKTHNILYSETKNRFYRIRG